MRKVSRVFCECRRHRCKGLHWSPENLDDEDEEEKKRKEEEEEERRRREGGGENRTRTYYEPPIPDDFVAGTSDYGS